MSDTNPAAPGYPVSITLKGIEFWMEDDGLGILGDSHARKLTWAQAAKLAEWLTAWKVWPAPVQASPAPAGPDLEAAYWAAQVLEDFGGLINGGSSNEQRTVRVKALERAVAAGKKLRAALSSRPSKETGADDSCGVCGGKPWEGLAKSYGGKCPSCDAKFISKTAAPGEERKGGDGSPEAPATGADQGGSNG